MWICAQELRNVLSQRFAVELPPTLTFDYPTPKDISGLVTSMLGSAAAGQQEEDDLPAEEEDQEDSLLLFEDDVLVVTENGAALGTATGPKRRARGGAAHKVPRSLIPAMSDPHIKGAAITGVSLRFAGGLTSLAGLQQAGEKSWELHCEAPFARFDAESVLALTPGKVCGLVITAQSLCNCL
jgi:hypothetical protein